MIPEQFAVLACIVMWLAGFLTCGSIVGSGPFWDGVRDGLTFSYWRDKFVCRRKD